MNIRYEEECNNNFALIGSPRTNQEEVEALKGIPRLVLVAQKLLLRAIRGVSWHNLSIVHNE